MRIRTIKPEWLDDESLVLASAEARVLSIALILLADDYGNGRANHVILSGRVFPGKVPETLANALADLERTRFVRLYEVDGQRYFSIRNWDKHQKVDKPGKPQVPVFVEVVKVPETLAKVPETLATDQDQDQDQEGTGNGLSRACTRTALVKAFQRRWEAERSAMWPGPNGDPEWDKAAKWVESTAALRALTVEQTIDRVLGHWFADPYVRRQNHATRHFAKNYANYIDPPSPEAPQKGQAKATSHEEFARLAAEKGEGHVGF